MDRNSVMVRTYTNQQDFTKDEQLLGQQGWSVQSTENQADKQSVLSRIRSLFTRTTSEASMVVTYYRPNPS